MDNWYGPSVDCLMTLVRSAGFVNPKLINIEHRHARVLAYRKWAAEPSNPEFPEPVLRDVLNSRNYGINFRSGAEEHTACWFQSSQPDLRLADVLVGAGGYATNSIYLQQEAPGYWLVNCPLPPGLAPGWREVRLCTSRSGFSSSCRIAVDMPVVCSDVHLLDATAKVVRPADSPPFVEIVCSVRGLAPNTDRGNTGIYANSRAAAVERVTFSPDSDEALVMGKLDEWRATLFVTLEHGGKMSDPLEIQVAD